MKLVSNVLIKLTRGGFTDRVLYLDNVPFDMLYEMKHPVIAKGEGMQQHWTADTSAEKIPTLIDCLKLSQTGDKGICFDLDNEQSKTQYMVLNRYIQSVYTNRDIPADPVVNSIDPTSQSAPALELSKVPRVVLPVLSPSEPKNSVTGSTIASSTDAPSVDVDAIKKEAVEQYKKEQKDRMAKARDGRKAPIQSK